MHLHTTARALVLASMLVGCSESAPNSSAGNEPQLPTEGTLTESGEVFELADFSLTLPDTMGAVDFTADDFRRQVASIGDRVSVPRAAEVAELVDRYRQTGQFKLIALDFTAVDPEFVDNLNAIVSRAPARATQSRLLELSRQSLAELGAEILSEDTLSANGYSFDRVRSRIAGAPFESTAYFLLHEGKAYTFTLTAKSERADAFFAQGESIMRSFRAR